MLIWSGSESACERGVGMLLSERAKKALIGYNTLRDRIISARFRGQPFNITVIQVYAPTADSSDPDIDDFYAQLGESIDRIHSQDIRFVIGDWNAKVGQDRTNCAHVRGKQGYGKRNERGERLIEFASVSCLLHMQHMQH